jgi:multiple sugar transport system substrate-binding protein
MTKLRGMTWDHVRGIAPLKAATEVYSNAYPDIQIDWDARSLKDFEDYPIEILAETYDLLLIDHPFVGTGVHKGVLEPLNEWLSNDYLKDQKANTVGKSYSSYTWDERQWALAVDTASQVAAYRKDLMGERGLTIPQSWDQVFELAKTLSKDTKVGIPLNPTHAYSSFLALCANMGGDDFWADKEAGIDTELGSQSLGMLQKLVSLVHPASTDMNPIDMSNLMSATNEIAYVPLMFGYSNYARDGFAPNVIHYTNIPSIHDQPSGAVLGGVGLAISSYSKHKDEAAKFVAYVGGKECQEGLYFESGGQPGYRAAWTNERVNDGSHDFFRNTLQTLDLAFMRPRDLDYNIFQEKAGHTIHRFLKEGGNAASTVREFNELFKNIVGPNIR